MKPVLFELPGLEWPVQAYGFFVALALIIGWLMSLEFARRDRLPTHVLGTNYVVSVVAGLLAARGGWLLQHPEAFTGWRSLFVLRAGELAAMAGVVVALFIGGALAATRRVPVVAWYCAATPAFALGLVFERIGALLAGTGFGIYEPELPWAIRYPNDSPVYALHRRELGRLLPSDAVASLPVHPTQLYAAGAAFLGFVAVVWARRHRRFSGQLVLGFGLYWLAVRSFVEEPLRFDREVAVMGALNGGQVVSIFVLLALAGIYWALRKGGRQLWQGDRGSQRR